jgi:hypothetical protein
MMATNSIMLGRRSYLVAVAAVVGALAGIELSGRSSPPSQKPNPVDDAPASEGLA